MFPILDEIRDLLEAGLKTSSTAESGTTTTNIKITGHGLMNGDVIVNTTRANARRSVVVVDADNLTVDAITAQTSGDTISIPKCKRFYAGGRVEKPAMNMCPVLAVYGRRTSLGRQSTATDQFTHEIVVEIVTNAFAKIQTIEDADKVVRVQKQINDLMEERDSTTNIPKSTTVLGVLRRNLVGTKYKYNIIQDIEYEEETVGDTIYARGRMILNSVTQFNPRT